MDNIVEFPNKEEQTISHSELKDLKEVLEGLMGPENEGSMLHSLGAMLEMNEEDFTILAPGVLQSFQQSVNNPNDKIILVQALNASGLRAEDAAAAFDGIVAEMDNMTTISVQKRDFLKSIMATIVNAVVETEGIAKRMIQIPVELCHPDAKMPQYANTTDSGMDVYALDDITVAPGETVLVPTGVKMAIPVGYEIQVRPKSGRALKTKLRVANTPGTIDAGYRDEIKVIIENVEAPIKDISYSFNDDGSIKIDSILHGSSYTIGKGEKFCQLVLMEVPKAALYRVDKVADIGEDRGGGFGSTGLK